MIQGVIFDLDGTLADSQLDFEAMRDEMQLPPGQPILEAVAALPAERQHECHAILRRHELEGAARATLLPGAGELLSQLESRSMPISIVTRNSREVTAATLSKLGIRSSLVITRDDGPVKPDPWGALEIIRHWKFDPRSLVMIGDWVFDIACGHAAGTWTVLLTSSDDEARCTPQPDLILPSLAHYDELLAWIDDR